MLPKLLGSGAPRAARKIKKVHLGTSWLLDFSQIGFLVGTLGSTV